jgi:hypothetical protein
MARHSPGHSASTNGTKKKLTPQNGHLVNLCLEFPILSQLSGFQPYSSPTEHLVTNLPILFFSSSQFAGQLVCNHLWVSENQCLRLCLSLTKWTNWCAAWSPGRTLFQHYFSGFLWTRLQHSNHLFPFDIGLQCRSIRISGLSLYLLH